MTTWDRVLLPFIKHKKMNYFKRECDEYGWKVIAVYGCFLLVMLYCVFGSVVPIGERFKNGNAGIGSALGALIVVLFAIYMITRIFVIFGVY